MSSAVNARGYNYPRRFRQGHGERYSNERVSSEAAEHDTRAACAPQMEKGKKLFEQRSQVLKHFVFFFRLRAVSEKEFLAQVQRFHSHCWSIKPVLYRTEEFISVYLAFSRVPCVTNRSDIELIERRLRFPIEFRDRICNQPVFRKHDQVVGVHAIV